MNSLSDMNKFINEWRMDHWEETILVLFENSARGGDSYIFQAENVRAPEFLSDWLY